MPRLLKQLFRFLKQAAEIMLHASAPSLGPHTSPFHWGPAHGLCKFPVCKRHHATLSIVKFKDWEVTRRTTLASIQNLQNLGQFKSKGERREGTQPGSADTKRTPVSCPPHPPPHPWLPSALKLHYFQQQRQNIQLTGLWFSSIYPVAEYFLRSGR